MLGFLSVILIYSAPLNQLAQGPTAPPNTQGQTLGQSQKSQQQQKQQQQEPLFLDGGKTISVTAFNFSGNSQVPSDRLQQLVSPYLDQSISQSDLGVIKGRIQSYYQSQGLPKPEVMIPVQENPSTLNIIIKESTNTK